MLANMDLARDGRTQLADYLVRLALDPSEMDRFDEDPESAMSGADLSEEEKDIVRSRDVNRLSPTFDGMGPASAIPIVAIVIVNISCT